MKKVQIEDPHRLLQILNTLLPFLKDMGFGQPSYGYFHGGDPRHFTPDAESTTPAEYARWKQDCEAFAHGEQGLTPRSCAPNEEPFSYTKKETGEVVTVPPGAALMTRSFYGLGINRNTEEAEMLADLEDVRRLVTVSAKSDGVENEPCPNCGVFRTRKDGVLHACSSCGDDDTEPVDPAEVP
jgi:hypothetical protein